VSGKALVTILPAPFPPAANRYTLLPARQKMLTSVRLPTSSRHNRAISKRNPKAARRRDAASVDTTRHGTPNPSTRVYESYLTFT